MLLNHKGTRLFLILSGFFLTNALIAEFIGVKIFSLEETMGWNAFNWSLLGESGSLQFTAGVLLWPFVFTISDIVNEYYGRRGVQFLSFLGAGLIIYAFAMVYMAMQLTPASWWIGTGEANGVPDMQRAFEAIFGQGLWIICGSLTAFIVGQIVDVVVFQWVKRKTGENHVWLRAVGSTLVSQLIDSYIVLYIAFVLGPQHWSVGKFLAIGTVNFVFKWGSAFAMIPLLYAIHWAIERYLGAPEAEKMKREAMGNS
jgi:queuosine precursor transporter